MTDRRKELRQLGKLHCNDANLSSIFEAKQLAVKLASNSIYGFCGAPLSQLPLTEIAECVCSIGRHLILTCRDFIDTLSHFSRVQQKKDEEEEDDDDDDDDGNNNNNRKKITICAKKCLSQLTFSLSEISDFLQVVYGDTDSVYVKFSGFRGDPKCLFQITHSITTSMNSLFPPPIFLEFERIMQPLLLVVKKHYAFYNFPTCDSMENPVRSTSSIVIKGLAAVRRDFSPIVKEITMNILTKLLCENNVTGAFECALEQIDNVLKGGVPIEKLVISRSLSKPVEQYANQSTSHVWLANRLPPEQRAIGTRIEFVFCRKLEQLPQKQQTRQSPHLKMTAASSSSSSSSSNSKNIKQKDVIDFRDTNRPLDFAYYVRHQILATVSDLLRLVDSFKFEKFRKVVDGKLNELDQKNSQQNLITKYFHQLPKKKNL